MWVAFRTFEGEGAASGDEAGLREADGVDDGGEPRTYTKKAIRRAEGAAQRIGATEISPYCRPENPGYPSFHTNAEPAHPERMWGFRERRMPQRARRPHARRSGYIRGDA